MTSSIEPDAPAAETDDTDPESSELPGVAGTEQPPPPDTPPTATRPSDTIRNMTPDRLIVQHDEQQVVLAPLETRQLDPPEVDWPWHRLVQSEVVAWKPALKDTEGPELMFGYAFWAFVGLLIATGVVAHEVPDYTGVVWFSAAGVALLLIVLAVAWFKAGGRAVSRQAAQLLMLILVVLVSLGMPLATVWRFTDEAPWTGASLAVSARIIQVAFITLAAMLPGLLFFFFDRQRLGTLRDRFAQQIFRLDPNVSTVADVQARYGSQMEEVFTGVGERDASRLARQRRWPILIATFALTFGWIVTLMPLGVLEPPTGPIDVAGTFVPQENHVAYGFLGAYFFSLNLVLRRYARGDLRPKAYSTITARILVVVILAWLIDAVVTDPNAWSLVVAFFAGVVPETVLTFLRETFRNPVITRASSELDETLPLKHLEGMDLYDRSRLLDEGVANVESLAHHDLIDLLLETRIPAGRLVDWVDQAILYLHVVGPTAGGSGSHVRVDLRKLGVRTATDLEAAAAKARKSSPSGLTQLNKACTGDGDDSGRLDLLLVSLADDEWMPYVRSWRRRAQLNKRTIHLDEQGLVTYDQPEALGQDVGPEDPGTSSVSENADDGHRMILKTTARSRSRREDRDDRRPNK